MTFQIAPIIYYLKFLTIIQIFFATSSNLKTPEALMNSELDKVKEWCDVKKLSINISKTIELYDYKTRQKKDFTTTIQIKNNDGTYKKLIRKDHIKYLSIMLDDMIS
jgi:hypothetical protein